MIPLSCRERVRVRGVSRVRETHYLSLGSVVGALNAPYGLRPAGLLAACELAGNTADKSAG
jgi:hypothetical protein